MHTPPVPLWKQLQAASAVVAAVRRGESATAAIARAPVQLRAGVQSLAFQALRQLGRAQALRTQLAKRPPPPAADALLLTALALACVEPDPPYAPFTLVDQTVEAAKRADGMRAQQAFLNACLRRFLREREALLAVVAQDPVATWNYPRWWIERVRADHPAHWQAILAAGNVPAPMTLRVNARRHARDVYARTLAEAGIAATPVGAYGLVLHAARPVHDIPGFDQGDASVQDAGAQLAAPLLLQGLPASAPMRILDACAAPGGKTAHLLELSDAQVLALDADPERCARIHDTLARLGLQAEIRAADAGDPAAWWDGRAFDAILLDAPCTASGIVRRHPDVRWLRRAGDIDRLAVQQARLLDALWPLLRPGGTLVYCTCSIFRAEGEERIAAFVTHNRGADLLPSPGHLLPQSAANTKPVPDNVEGDHDGFFYAVLHKRAA